MDIDKKPENAHGSSTRQQNNRLHTHPQTGFLVLVDLNSVPHPYHLLRVIEKVGRVRYVLI